MHPLPVMAFPYNQPSWSLFWELAANLLFVLVAPRLGTRTLAAVIALLVAARFGLALGTGRFNPIDITAAPRALSTFALGMLLFRVHASGHLRLPRWIGLVAAPVLIITLMLPARWLFPLDSYVLYPLVIVAAADRTPRFPRLCAFLGGFSYPLYILHEPIMIGLAWLLGFPAGAMMIVQPIACLLIVWLAWRFYDEPVRTWLRRRFGSREHRASPATAR